MNGLVGGPLLVEGLPPLKSGPDTIGSRTVTGKGAIAPPPFIFKHAETINVQCKMPAPHFNANFTKFTALYYKNSYHQSSCFQISYVASAFGGIALRPPPSSGGGISSPDPLILPTPISTLLPPPKCNTAQCG